MKKITGFLLFFVFVCSFFVSGNAWDIVAYSSIHTLEEYEQFVREHELPDSFLFYEDLSFFGEFRWLYVSDKDISNYTYEFYNESNELSVILEIDDDNEFQVFGREVQPPEGDLIQNVYADQYFSQAASKLCYCFIGKFRFTYSGSFVDSASRLSSIKWENEDSTAYYSLYIEDLDPSKPLTGFLGDLLSAERSETARQQLYDLTVHGKKFEYPPAPAPFPWLWVIVPAGVILVGGGTAALLLLHKRKKAAKE